MRPLDEIERGGQKFFVHSLHALPVERSSVLDVAIGGGLDDAARTVLLAEGRILRVVVALGLLLRVQMVEIAEELVKTVVGRQVLVLVAEVVLAELARHVATFLGHIGDRRRPVRNAVVVARHADGQQTCPERMLAKNEGGSPCGAGLLRVGVGEERPFLGEAVDIGRLIAHDAVVVGADVVNADIVSVDEEDVRHVSLLLRSKRRGRQGPYRCSHQDSPFQIWHFLLPS